MVRPFLYVLCAAAGSLSAAAQLPRAQPAPHPSATAESQGGAARGAKDPYMAEPAVFVRFDTVYRYRADGTGSKVDSAVVRVQGEAAVRGLSVLSVPYSADTEKVEFVSVRVHKPSGVTVNTPAGEMQDQPTRVTQATPIYSDRHLALLPVRGLAMGDRLEYQVRTLFTASAAKDQFWATEGFGMGRVVLERFLELHVPADKFVQVICPKYPARETEEGSERVYRWSGAQTRPTVLTTSQGRAVDDRAPGDVTPPIAWTTFHSWAELGDWYRGLAGGSTATSPSLKAKADQVVFGLSQPRARIDALFAYVSREVMSLDVPLGEGSWQAHTPEEVLNNQFGDGKDKSALLAAMLRAEKITASVALVPASGQVDPAFPAPSWFTQVVTVANDPGHGAVWLNPLSEVTPPGVLDRSLRDAFALVVPEKDEPELLRTPSELPFVSTARFEANGSVAADGAFQAHVDMLLRGDEELRYRGDLHRLGPAQWDELTQSLVETGGFSGSASNTVASKPEETGAPLHLSFDLEGKKFGDWENFRIAPPEPRLELPYMKVRTDPGREIPLGGKRKEVAVSRLALPASFGADLPPALHVHTAFADLDKTYRLEKTGSTVALVTERTLEVKEGKLAASEWPAYRKFLDDAGEGEPWIQLTTRNAAGNHHPPAAGENNPEAEQLLAEAGEAIQRKDWSTATTKLDGAKELSSRQPYLWSSYAEVERGLGKREAATEDDRRELKAHPEEGSVSRRLAAELAGSGSDAEAAEVLKAALALNPRDERTVVMLGTLQAKANPAAAEKTFRVGLAAESDSTGLKMGLGRVLLQEGKRDEAAALLGAVATDSQDAGLLNDAAFALGDAGLNLRVAEAASRRAIQILNAGAARGDDRGRSDAELQRSVALVASWDTFGWILFKEGFASEAEPWLAAAWADGYGAEPGRHLALLLQKQGRSAEASGVLRMAGQGSSLPRQSARGTRTVVVPRPAGGPAGSAVFKLETSLNAPDLAHFLYGDQALASMTATLGRVNTNASLPPGTQAHLFRQGVLRCGIGPTCTLEVVPIGAALAE